MTLDDFGKLVTATAHVKVKVDKSIAERKACIFCEDRPLSEVIARLSDTLFLDWVKQPGGYLLRLDPKVAEEETAMLAARDDLSRRQVDVVLHKLANLVNSTPEQLKNRLAQLQSSMQDLQSDKSDAGRERLQEATAEYQLLQPFEHSRLRWDAGYVLNQAGDSQFSKVEDGKTLYASTLQLAGTYKIKPDALSAYENPAFSTPSPDDFMVLGINYDAEGHNVVIQSRACQSTSAQGSTDLIACGEGPEVWDELAKQPLWKRILGWSQWPDTAVQETKLDREAKLPPADLEGCWTLADNLEWLHDRTGVPIVADSPRAFASFNNPLQAATLKEWATQLMMSSFDPSQNRHMDWVGARMKDGWFMAKDRRYWTRLDTEIPERLIRPLEQKVAAKQALWIDDYAGFVGQLTPRQAAGARDQIVHFPAYPLVSVDLLSLWYDLGSSNRAATKAEGGVRIASLDGDGPSRVFQFLLPDALFGTMDPRFVKSFLPGGPPLPQDLSISYQDTRQSGVTINGMVIPDHIRFGAVSNNTFHSVQGVTILIGRPEGAKLQYSIILEDPLLGAAPNPAGSN